MKTLLADVYFSHGVHPCVLNHIEFKLVVENSSEIDLEPIEINTLAHYFTHQISYNWRTNKVTYASNSEAVMPL